MMNTFSRYVVSLLSVSFALGVAVADDAETPVPAEPTEAESASEQDSGAEESISVGTKLYDAETVSELFREYKQENERRAEELAPHMNSELLDVVELAPVNVQAYEVNNMDLLLERLDPQPRRRLQRLAELDPAAAADLRVSMRSEERFFVGEQDFGSDGNAGSTANFDLPTVGKSVAQAVKRARESMQKAKVTDDQQEIPTGE